MDVLSVCQSALDKTSLIFKKNWPTIGTYAGIGLMALGTISACKATANIDEADSDAFEPIAMVKTFPEDYPTEKEYNKALTHAYVNGCFVYLRLYSKAVLLELAGATLIMKSHGEMKTRYNDLSLAFNGVQAMFNHYRKSVISDLGKKADLKYMYGIEDQEIETEFVNESGEIEKHREVYENVMKMDGHPTAISPYAKFFDESSKYYNGDPEYDRIFLKLCEASCENILTDRKYLFLNEVYEMIGIPPTKAGQYIGWYYDPTDKNLSNYVDFGLCNVRREDVRRFVNGYEHCILLDFNVDGDILDRIPDIPLRRMWREPHTNIIHEV